MEAVGAKSETWRLKVGSRWKDRSSGGGCWESFQPEERCEFDAGWDDLREEKLERAIELGLVPAETKLPPPPPTHRAWDDLSAEDKVVSAREMQVNAGLLEAADQNIGRLLEHLKKSGVLENTIVIVTSDNGAESAETEFQGAFKTAMLEGIKLIEGFDTSFENLVQQHSLTAIGPERAQCNASAKRRG